MWNRGVDRLSADCASISSTLHPKLRPFFDNCAYESKTFEKACAIVGKMEGSAKENATEQDDQLLHQLVTQSNGVWTALEHARHKGVPRAPTVRRLTNTAKPSTEDDLDSMPSRLQHAYRTMQTYAQLGEPVAPLLVDLMVYYTGDVARDAEVIAGPRRLYSRSASAR